MQTTSLFYSLRSSASFDKLILAFGVIFISFSSVLVHLISAGPAIIGAYRMAIGGFILLLFALIRKERLFTINRLTLPAILAGLFFCLDLATWHQSIRYVGPGLATILNSCQIFFLLFISLFILKEHMHKRQMIALACIIPGGLLLCLNDWLKLGSQYHWGVIIGLVSGLCYSGYIYTLRKANSKDNTQKSPGTLSTLTTVTFSAMIFLIIIAVLSGEKLTLGSSSNYTWVSIYALVSQVIGWGLISYALPKVNVSVAAFILILQPALAFIWDVLFFNRATPWFEWLGIFIILIAVFLANHRRSNN